MKRRETTGENRYTRGNCKTLIPSVFAAQRDGVIAQALRGRPHLAFAHACGTLAAGRLFCNYLTR